MECQEVKQLECEARKRALYAMQRRGKGEGEGGVVGVGEVVGVGAGEGVGKNETCTLKCGIIQNMNKARQIAPIAAAVISGGFMACAETAQNAAVRASCVVQGCADKGLS